MNLVQMLWVQHQAFNHDPKKQPKQSMTHFNAWSTQCTLWGYSYNIWILFKWCESQIYLAAFLRFFQQAIPTKFPTTFWMKGRDDFVVAFGIKCLLLHLKLVSFYPHIHNYETGVTRSQGVHPRGGGRLNVACMDLCRCTKEVLIVLRGYKIYIKYMHSSFVNIPCVL